MSNIRFIVDNVVDDGTVTANPVAQTGFDVDNIQTVPRSKVFRSVDDTAQDIYITLPESETISSMVIGRHNFSSNITYQLILYSDAAWTNIVHDTGVLQVTSDQAATDLWEWGQFAWGSIPWGGDRIGEDNREFYNVVLWLDQDYTGINSIALKLSFADVGDFIYTSDIVLKTNDESPDIFTSSIYWPSGGATGSSNIPYYEIGRLIIGDYIEPLYNLSYGHSLNWKENTSQYRPSSGTLQSDVVTSNKEINFSLNTIPESDRSTVHKQLVEVGLEEDFFISLFPEDLNMSKQIDYSAIAKFTKVPKYTEFLSDYYKTTFTVEEV